MPWTFLAFQLELLELVVALLAGDPELVELVMWAEELVLLEQTLCGE